MRKIPRDWITACLWHSNCFPLKSAVYYEGQGQDDRTEDKTNKGGGCLQNHAGTGILNQEIQIMGFTVFCELKENLICFFQQIRHVLNRTIQGREKVIPVHRNDQLCPGLFDRFREEFLFHFRIGFCKACDAEKDCIGTYAVKLAFDIIETGANHNLLVFVDTRKAGQDFSASLEWLKDNCKSESK